MSRFNFDIFGMIKKLPKYWAGDAKIGKEKCIHRHILGANTAIILIKAYFTLHIVKFSIFTMLMMMVMSYVFGNTHMKYYIFGIMHTMSFMFTAKIILGSKKKDFDDPFMLTLQIFVCMFAQSLFFNMIANCNEPYGRDMIDATKDHRCATKDHHYYHTDKFHECIDSDCDDGDDPPLKYNMISTDKEKSE
jgi:hypothetical protein